MKILDVVFVGFSWTKPSLTFKHLPNLFGAFVTAKAQPSAQSSPGWNSEVPNHEAQGQWIILILLKGGSDDTTP